MKRELYISLYLLILAISLICLIDHPSGSARNGADESYYKTLKHTNDIQIPEDPNDYDPWEWETSDQSCILCQTNGTLPGKVIVLPALMLQQVLLNPSLVDLPPPPLIIS